MQIPLFPLPNVVLFPGVYLPLHIFEPRYRDDGASTRSTATGMIGMTLLQARLRGTTTKAGRPSIRFGCAGVITHAERLDDGRFNIVLQGTERFRIEDEDQLARLPDRDGRAD